MLARRRAAGYQRRGRDVSGQIVRVGDIAPNPDTVVATIVGLVAGAGGSITRGALLDAMAAATFAHPKAEPGDRGWCEGYVAGALRDGFLAGAGDGERAAAVIAWPLRCRDDRLAPVPTADCANAGERGRQPWTILRAAVIASIRP